MNRPLTQLELSYSTPERARRLEHENNWFGAKLMWDRLGFFHKKDSDACQLIMDGNALGDAYRAEVLAVAGPEPDRSDSHAWCKWFGKMEDVYRKHYK